MKSKITIRRFPPGYTSDLFYALLKPWHDQINYKLFQPGHKPKARSTDPVIPGVGFVSFKTAEALLDATERLSGMQVKDEEGFEGILEVRLALSQLIPPSQSPPAGDPLAGTYEESEAFKKFLEELEVKPALLPLDKQVEFMLEKEKEINPWKYSKDLAKKTPLLAHLEGKERPVVQQKVIPPKSEPQQQQVTAGKRKKKRNGTGASDLELPTSTTKSKQKTPKPPANSNTKPSQPQASTHATISTTPKPAMKIMARPKDSPKNDEPRVAPRIVPPNPTSAATKVKASTTTVVYTTTTSAAKKKSVL